MLTPERIDAINVRTLGHQHFARAIEAEVRKEYAELIRQMLETLECTGEPDDPGHRCGHCDDYVDRNAVVRTAARKRLEGMGAPPEQPADHPPTIAACIARLEQGGQSAAVSILRHHFEQAERRATQ